MNMATRAVLGNPFQQRVSLFHCSPILERKRRTHWDFGRSTGSQRKSNFNSRRYRKMNSRQALFDNVNAFAEQFFQRECDEYERQNSWFKRDFFKASGNKSRNKGPNQQKGFKFFEDFDDIETHTFFRSAFGGNRYYYWSFMNEERNNFNDQRRSNWNSRHEYYDESTDSEESLESDLSRERVMLGLNASGPLNLEDVKSAYRVCALKWHPDRHHGASKDVAEEKFKACSAAYQCLCDKL